MSRLAVFFAMAFLAVATATGQEKLTLTQASIARSEGDGSFIALNDGSKFQVEDSYRGIAKQWPKGTHVYYRPTPEGHCSRFAIESAEHRDVYVCVSLPLSHGGKDVPIQVVQMLTKDSIVTQSSAFAWSMATLIPSWQRNAAQGPTATGLGTSSGTSVSTEVTKIVGMNAILNGQNIRLQCAEPSCHGLNASSYNSELKGADAWITSYGQRWDAKQETLVREEYNEHWKIVGASQ